METFNVHSNRQFESEAKTVNVHVRIILFQIQSVRYVEDRESENHADIILVDVIV